MKKIFNKPYMDNINPSLLLRYWRSKGSPGRLIIRKYGISFEFINTKFGELVKKVSTNKRFKMPGNIKENENET